MKRRIVNTLVVSTVAIGITLLAGCGAKKDEPVNLTENINAEPEIIDAEDTIHTFDANGEVFDNESLEEEDFEEEVPKSATPEADTSKEDDSDKKTGTSKEDDSDKKTGTSKVDDSDKKTGTSKEDDSDKKAGTSKEDDSDKKAGTLKENNSDKKTETSKEDGADKKSSISEEEMDSLLEQVVEATDADIQDIRCCAFDDFDGNGTYEGTVYVGAGPDSDFGWCEGTVYYVNSEECKKIYSGTLADMDGNVFRVIDAGDRKFILFDEAYVTALVTYVYYVDDAVLKESNISRFGDISSDTDLQNIVMSFSTYDGFCTYEKGQEDSPDWTGHTWKPYYFYYDEEKKDFMEYAGSEITRDELEEIVGFDLATEIENEDYQIDNILRRKNGIVNVNYSKKEVLEDGTIDITYNNATYDEKTGTFVDVWETGNNGWQDSNYGGIYMDALNVGMAVY
ncbi:hypothetical protein [Butyrivibrio sp. VCD2006]|uniref:hypothetical protein n=1 Tax=Butyrivibrio sp. VCD2006 TaxID=1280664 RepID=UPI0004128244|nr:hypothetical protein [Butyrivibrio sp. VCD2006]